MRTNIFFFIAFITAMASTAAAVDSNLNPPDGMAKFVVVLDAGHGGDDGGNSHHGVYEKNVALKAVLAVGKKLEAHGGFEVIYTRKTDVFIPLNKRADIANKAKADLFVSIHCNSFHKSQANGNETWVLGLTKSKDNLDVVMRENNVILLEENYEENYKGYDPNDPSAYVTSLLTQEQFMEDSIELAAMIQGNFAQNVKRVNRGVKQNWFVVLLKSYMPSVLIEIGFLSNPSERDYLTSKKGHDAVVKSIYDGILKYRETRDVNLSTVSDGNTSGVAVDPVSNDAIYKVQIAAGSKAIAAKSYNFNKLPEISRVKSGNIYRYYSGSFDSLEKANDLRAKAIKKGYKTAFIVVVENGVYSRL
ncbi:N-acetylmuramoyl-L-alanine amidase [Nonlabens ponticola]|uniref:N-acetylmuramoyl-L-alanine amidase n=1 Tax=Nonlabens ponticola TaxID=2496866 RepID=A0A3S9MZ48_9FLAO|nr:N-acetylmuramoyl-L-alanine amidase [Nonlabens ponticola]AZQ44531.1 N-acetylmuramoyl-L-alanine amidase [Nonlabens ponticola]